MSVDVFYIKQGDTSPALLYSLSPAPSTLVGATIVFSMRKNGTVYIDEASADYTDTSVLRYQWQAGDTDEVGVYEAEFQVTYADGTIGSWPNVGYIPVSIGDDI